MKTIIICLSAMLLSACPALGIDFIQSHILPELDSVHTFDVADFTGDGQLDLVIVYYGNKQLDLYAGDAEGRFNKTHAIASASRYRMFGSLQSADMDNDGDLDLIVLQHHSVFSESEVFLLENDGIGNFAHRTIEQARGQMPEDFSLADMNNDGLLDIVAAGGKYVVKYPWRERWCYYWIWTNRGDWDLELGRVINTSNRNVAGQRQGIKVFAGDFDRDGFGDMALAMPDQPGNAGDGCIDLHFGHSSPDTLWSEWVSYDNIYVENMLLADFSGNNFDDLCILGQDARVLMTLQRRSRDFDGNPGKALNRKGNGKTSILWVYQPELHAGDFDLDGRIDLLRIEPKTQTASIFLNTQEKVFQHEPQLLELDYIPASSVVKDLNGDGYLDVIVSHKWGKGLYVWYNSQGGGSVKGRVAAPSNGGCQLDDSAHSLQGKIVEFLPGPYYAFTDANGEYTRALPVGNYSVSVVDEADWTTDCELAVQDVSIADIDYEVVDLDFPRIATALNNQLHVSLVSSRFRPGLKGEFIIEYLNTGTIPYKGALNLRFDEGLTYISATQLPDVNQPGRLQWQLQNIPIGGAGTIVVEAEVAREVTNGAVLCAFIEAEIKRDDLMNNDHTDEICTDVTGSYDPNDIRVWPRGQGENGVISRDVNSLSYMIRFQNTGNDTAFTVVVRDTLPPELNVRRLRFGAASHEYTVDLLNNNILEFTFDDILLPDNTTDELGSQGYVRFRIDLQADLPLGTQIRNRAGIYFDFNPVVLTNTALTTISETTTRVDDVSGIDKLHNAPNPVSELTTISNIPADVTALVISDMQGRILLRLNTNSRATMSVDCSSLATGVYLVRTMGGTEMREVQISVVR